MRGQTDSATMFASCFSPREAVSLCFSLVSAWECCAPGQSGGRATLTTEDMRLRAEEKWKRCRMVAVSFSAPLCFGLETHPAVCVHPVCQNHVKNIDAVQEGALWPIILAANQCYCVHASCKWVVIYGDISQGRLEYDGIMQQPTWTYEAASLSLWRGKVCSWVGFSIERHLYYLYKYLQPEKLPFPAGRPPARHPLGSRLDSKPKPSGSPLELPAPLFASPPQTLAPRSGRWASCCQTSVCLSCRSSKSQPMEIRAAVRTKTFRALQQQDAPKQDEN